MMTNITYSMGLLAPNPGQTFCWPKKSDTKKACGRGTRRPDRHSQPLGATNSACGLKRCVSPGGPAHAFGPPPVRALFVILLASLCLAWPAQGQCRYGFFMIFTT